MKAVKNLISIIVVIVLITSCTNRDSVNVEISIEDIPITKVYNGSRLPIKELVNVRNFFVKDSFLVVNNSRNDSLFMVFNLHNFSCISSWGIKGRGPEEFGTFTFVMPLEKGRLIIADYSQLRAYIHEIPNPDFKEVVKFDYGIYDSDIREIPQDIETHEGTSFYYINMPRNVISLKRWSFGNAPHDLISFSFLGSNYKTPYPYFGCFAINSEQEKIAYAYNYLRRFDIFDFNGELIKSINIKPSLELPLEEGSEFDIVNSKLSYKQIRSYGNYLFLLYIGKSPNDVTENLNTEVVFIDQYDWSGKPIARFQLNKFIIDFDIVWDGDELVSIVGVDPFSESNLVLFEEIEQ